MTDERKPDAEIVEKKKLVCPFLPPMMGQNTFRQQTLSYMTCLGDTCQIWDPQAKQCGMARKPIALS